MRTIAFVLASVLAIAAGAADLQGFKDCPPGTAEAAKVEEAHIRSLTPRDKGYLPHPFPSTEVEIRSNFRYEFLRLHPGVRRAKDAGPQDRELWTLVKENLFVLSVLEVENWSGRCSVIPGAKSFVLRVFDPRRSRRQEVARVAMHMTGGIASWQSLDGFDESLYASAMKMYPDLGDSVRKVEQGYDLAVASARWVLTSVVPGDPCRAMYPCIAVESSGRTFLLLPDVRFGDRWASTRLFEVGGDVTRVDGATLAPSPGEALMPALSPDEVAVQVRWDDQFLLVREVRAKDRDEV